MHVMRVVRYPSQKVCSLFSGSANTFIFTYAKKIERITFFRLIYSPQYNGDHRNRSHVKSLQFDEFVCVCVYVIH